MSHHLKFPFPFFLRQCRFLFFYFFQIREVTEEEAEEVVVGGGLCTEAGCIALQQGAKGKGGAGGQETGGTEQGHSKEREGCVFTDLVRAPPPTTPP